MVRIISGVADDDLFCVYVCLCSFCARLSIGWLNAAGRRRRRRRRMPIENIIDCVDGSYIIQLDCVCVFMGE